MLDYVFGVVVGAACGTLITRTLTGMVIGAVCGIVGAFAINKFVK